MTSRHGLGLRAGLAWLALLAGPCVAAEATGEDPHVSTVERDIEPTIQVRGRAVERTTLAETMAQHHTPAVSVAVSDHGRIVWAKAWGWADVASRTPATPETVFQAGSISKPVAASAALELAQAGQLDLNADVNSQLKSWRLPVSPFTATRPVTLRAILSHSAGLSTPSFNGYAAGAPLPTVVQVLDGEPPANSAPVRSIAVPGSGWAYSGGGYVVAQLAMTDATGEAFPELMRRRVLQPLGMASSTFEQPLPADRRDAASGYDRHGEPIQGRFHVFPELTAAGLWTTPSDLARWSMALQRAYDGRDETLMRQATARAMLTPGLNDWGLGVAVKGKAASLRFEHGGADLAYKAFLTGYLEGGRGVVVMTNGDDGWQVVNAVAQAVARAYGWQGLEPRMIDEAPLSAAERASFVGSYAGGQIRISLEDGRLWLKVQDDPRRALTPTSLDQLVVMDGWDLKFVRDANGAVVRFEVDGQQIPRDR